jgi:YbgC/YbaW family acyl-CoA thioester hydrolase
MIMSHRVEVLHDLVGFSIMHFARSGVAFPARNVNVSYQRPAFVGDVLEIGSWLTELGTSSFEVRAIVTGADDRTVRALARVHFVTVDASTGRLRPRPHALPSTAASSPIPDCPPPPSTWPRSSACRTTGWCRRRRACRRR